MNFVTLDVIFTVLSSTATLIFHIAAILACIKYLRKK